jgi:hypothetical protein
MAVKSFMTLDIVKNFGLMKKYHLQKFVNLIAMCMRKIDIKVS